MPLTQQPPEPGNPLLRGFCWWFRQSGQHLTPTTEADGVGPVTVRRYWMQVQDSPTPPEAVIQHVAQHFAQLLPFPIAVAQAMQDKPRAMQVGDKFFLWLTFRRAWVEIDVLEPLRFRNRTLRPHPVCGWVELQAVPQTGSKGKHSFGLILTSRVRTSSWVNRLGYVLGVSYLQRLTWEILLRRSVAWSGGRQTERGHETQEFPYR